MRESASNKTLLHKCDQPYQLTEANFNQISSNPCRNCDNFCSLLPAPKSLLPTPYSLLPAPCSLCYQLLLSQCVREASALPNRLS
ncbi:MAG: hypothetical protein F6J90_32655 [Moorea sp. SIOASIH]|uniref:hypothetical protein n=1 Tax=Moorena sp. SIOASIH TaxID=2607817 RepID=UPI0013B60F72|nr:hypothetical protein [Moorena sp. SIOASIH]NEO40830.1 hypothetical protein [Moorena sp. SIOASIH]NEO91705.1 hypothetical protein [Moorena sp. SIO3G5]